MGEDPVVSLEPTMLSVAPGQQAQVKVTVANRSTRVQGYLLTVLGDHARSWSQVAPAELNVYTDEEGTAVLTLAPPAGPATPGGLWPFGVLARSSFDGSSASAEGDVEVGEEFALQATLVPVSSTGRWRGRHQLTIVNYGNATARVRLLPSDPDEALGFLVRPPSLEIPGGGSAHARLWVRTRRPMLRGVPLRLPFTVTVERADVPPPPGPPPSVSTLQRPVVQAAFTQQPILDRWAVLLAGLLLVALVAGVAYTWNGPELNERLYQDVSKPRPPTLVAVEVTGPTTANVLWEAVPDVEVYKVKFIDQATGASFGIQPVDGQQNQYGARDLPAGKAVCFRVLSAVDRLESTESNEKCLTMPREPDPSTSLSPGPTAGSSPTSAAPASSASTSQPPPTDSTTPVSPSSSGSSASQATDVFAENEWIIFAALPTASSDDQPPIEFVELRQKLRNNNINAGIYEVAQYPRTRMNANVLQTGWVVYAGPYSDKAAAVGDCERVLKVTGGGSGCDFGQPNPPQ